MPLTTFLCGVIYPHTIRWRNPTPTEDGGILVYDGTNTGLVFLSLNITSHNICYVSSFSDEKHLCMDE